MKSASNESFQSELSQAFASGQSSVALEVTELHKYLYAYSQRHWLSDGFLGKVIETSTRFLRAAYFWTIDKLFNFQVFLVEATIGETFVVLSKFFVHRDKTDYFETLSDSIFSKRSSLSRVHNHSNISAFLKFKWFQLGSFYFILQLFVLVCFFLFQRKRVFEKSLHLKNVTVFKRSDPLQSKIFEFQVF